MAINIKVYDVFLLKLSLNFICNSDFSNNKYDAYQSSWIVLVHRLRVGTLLFKAYRE